MVVEPIHPFEGGIFDCLEIAPWPAAVDDLGLEETVDGENGGAKLVHVSGGMVLLRAA